MASISKRRRWLARYRTMWSGQIGGAATDERLAASLMSPAARRPVAEKRKVHPQKRMTLVQPGVKMKVAAQLPRLVSGGSSWDGMGKSGDAESDVAICARGPSLVEGLSIGTCDRRGRTNDGRAYETIL